MKQLSAVQPETLLFLCKIKRISIRETSCNFITINSISSVVFSRKTNLVSSVNKGADARIVCLSVREESDSTKVKCCYYIWRQVFRVKSWSRVKRRNDVKEWLISLAFPLDARLKKGDDSSIGIFAFLPTSMVTNFPFIVQADFVLASSRETILMDNNWNMGILGCVASSFVNALNSLVKLSETETTSCFPVARVVELLPTRESPYKELNRVRESIRRMLQAECIIPCEPFSSSQKTFCLPAEAVRILPDFRRILLLIRDRGFSLSLKFVLHTSVDLQEYDEVLDFIGVSPMVTNYAWYGKCIRICNLMSQEVPTDVYIEILCFLAENWRFFPPKSRKNIPLLRYLTWNCEVATSSVCQIKQEALKVRLVLNAQKHAWLNKWNVEMGCPNGTFFLPDAVVAVLEEHEKQHIVIQWLVCRVGVVITSVSQYCSGLGKFAAQKNDPKLAVLLANLVYHSTLKYYIGMYETFGIFRGSMPIVDGSGQVHALKTSTVLVPASGSKWAKLFGLSNQFAGRGSIDSEVKNEMGETNFLGKYVELGEVYNEAANLLDFLVKRTAAVDLPYIQPTNDVLEIAYSQLTSDQAILLLEWIHVLRTKGYEMPSRFIESIRNGRWMKTYSGFNSPTRCFLCDGGEGSTLLEIGKSLKVFSLIDQEFYMDRISAYSDELKLIGVRVGFEHWYQLIIEWLMQNSPSSFSREWAVYLLHFIKCSKMNCRLNEDLLNTVIGKRWLKTNKGYKTPLGSLFLKSGAEAILQIADLPVIDQTFYKGQIDCFVDELRFLGTVVDLEGIFPLIPSYFRFPKDYSTLTIESILLILECIRYLGPAACSLINKIRDHPWIKTTSGFRYPTESILYNEKWDHLLKVIPLPIIDETFYGDKLKVYKAELKAIGVAVGLDGIFKLLCSQVKLLVSSGTLTSALVISILECMGKVMPSQLLELRSCFLGEKWLKTCHGYKYASDSVLLTPEWEKIAEFVDLPLIDEAFYGVRIYLYKDQLKMLGAIVDFSEGAHFVAKGLSLPQEPTSMTADSALLLLQCVKSLRTNSSDQFHLDKFLKNLKGSKWMKTNKGYKYPEESIFFDPEWSCCLEKDDAPFLDQNFYNNFASLEKDDLKAIGVKTDTDGACKLISEMIYLHTQTCAIVRIYKFLDRFRWTPGILDGASPRVWIPDHSDRTGGGKWVASRVCVLQNSNKLLLPHLHSLDQYYEKELLPFFKLAYGVAEGPLLDDYMKLWNQWLNDKHELTPTECHFFWEHISENWNPVTKEILEKNITMLPTTLIFGASIQVVEKKEVFIPDDLQLKKLFTSEAVKPLFVWYPQEGNLSSLTPAKLNEIYASLGVQKISEAVHYDFSCTMSLDHKLEVDLRNELIGKALIKIVLAFLANSQVNMSAREREQIANALLNISVFWTEEPIVVSYGLFLTSQKVVKSTRMVLWEKEFHRMIVHKSSWKGKRKSIEFVTEFARAVSGGVLPERTDLGDKLCKIVQMGCAFGFKEDAVEYLMVSENLELSATDEDFVNVAFPSAAITLPSPNPLKRLFIALTQEAPSLKKHCSGN